MKETKCDEIKPDWSLFNKHCQQNLDATEVIFNRDLQKNFLDKVTEQRKVFEKEKDFWLRLVLEDYFGSLGDLKSIAKQVIYIYHPDYEAAMVGGIEIFRWPTFNSIFEVKVDVQKSLQLHL